MSATDELKPCPFCGSKELLAGFHSPFIECGNCHAFGPGNADLTHDEAVELWNTRTPEQAIAATLGRQGYYTDRDDEGTHIMCDRCGEYIGTAEEIAAALGDDGYKQAAAYWKRMYEELLTERIGEERDYPEEVER